MLVRGSSSGSCAFPFPADSPLNALALHESVIRIGEKLLGVARGALRLVHSSVQAPADGCPLAAGDVATAAAIVLRAAASEGMLQPTAPTEILASTRQPSAAEALRHV